MADENLPSGFTPALGYRALTPLYDFAIALLTRKRRWRGLLAPKKGDVIAHVVCGTGTFAVMVGKAALGVEIIGIDPDREILKRAASKATKAGVEIDLLGFARHMSPTGSISIYHGYKPLR